MGKIPSSVSFMLMPSCGTRGSAVRFGRPVVSKRKMPAELGMCSGIFLGFCLPLMPVVVTWVGQVATFCRGVSSC